MILLSFSISLVESGEVLKSLTSQLGSRSSLRYVKYYTHYNVRVSSEMVLVVHKWGKTQMVKVHFANENRSNVKFCDTWRCILIICRSCTKG